MRFCVVEVISGLVRLRVFCASKLTNMGSGDIRFVLIFDFTAR